VKKIIWYLFLLLLTALGTWSQYRYSFYGLGIFLIPIFAILAMTLSIVLGYLGFLQKTTWWSKGLWIYALFLVLSTAHIAWEQYKPTLEIIVPKDFAGNIHILPSPDVTNGPIQVTKMGIAWAPGQGEYEYKVTQGLEDITNVLNEYGRSNHTFWDSENSDSIFVSVICISIRPGIKYPSSHWNQWHARCYSKTQLDSVLKVSEAFYKTKNPRIFGIPKNRTP